MKKFLTGAFVMAIVGTVAYFIVLVVRGRQISAIGTKNVDLKVGLEGKKFESIAEREEAVRKEVAAVAEMQVEEVVSAWKSKFGR